MTRVTCSFCGLPFSVRKVEEGTSYYCCSGCALASRIPMNDGQLPISRGLVVALALGFGVFNETLFTVVAGAIAADGRAEIGVRFAQIGVIIGCALALASIAFILAPRSRRWSDFLASAIAVSICVHAGILFHSSGAMAARWPLFGANVWMASWLARGWLRRFIRRSRPASARHD